jgi:hypothetical protein
MIAFFDNDEIVANHISSSARTLIAEGWKKLIEKEKKLRDYMKTSSADEPFIGQYAAHAWITPDNIEEFIGFFLKRLAEANEDTFIFHYDGGYVAFSGHNSTTIITAFQKIEDEMYANCMRTLVEK